MKKFLALLSILALQRAVALPNYEPFANATGTAGGTSYAVGAALANQTNALLQGWGGLGSNFPGPEPLIANANLSYAPLPASSGNSVSFVGATNMGTRLDLQTNGASGTFYYSYILQITNISAVPTTNANNPFAGFSDTAGSQPQQLGRLGTRVLTRQSGAGFVLGLGRNNTISDFVYDTNVFNVNDVIFLVGSYDVGTGFTNVNLWINPPTNTFGTTNVPTPTLSAATYTSTGGALNGNGVRSFAIICQFATAPSGILDELRVEKNWGDVTGGAPPSPISIVAQPTPRGAVAGDNVAFAVTVTGTSPIYQWRKNDVAVPGGTLAALSISNVQAANAGTYTVAVSNLINAVTSAPVVLTVSATAPRLEYTNLVAIRIGTGAQVLTNSGNSIALDQFTPGGTYLNTVSIPDSGASPLVAIGPNISGSSLTGNCLTRSSDQRFLVVGGYNTNLAYGANLKDSVPATVPRGIATINTFAQYSLKVANTDYSGYSQVYWRGGVTDNGTNFWGAATGTAGTYYFGFDAPASVIQTNFGNVRSIAIFNGNIYCVSAVSGNNGVMKLNGMPTTFAAAIPTILFPGSTSSSDLEVSPDGNLIYVADDRTAPNGGGVQRWQFDGSTWSRSYTLTNGLLDGARYVTADFSGANPVVYAVSTDTDNTRLVRINDTGATAAGTTFALAGANQTFRGIRFGPSETAIALRPKLSFMREGANVILSWSGAFFLQSSTNVTGTFTNISGATSPYTNAISPETQRYFRLQN